MRFMMLIYPGFDTSIEEADVPVRGVVAIVPGDGRF